MAKELFTTDLSDEQTMSLYLDNHLYNNGLFERHDRTPNKSEQKLGCDIVLTSKYWGIENCLVDEKTQMTYFNKDQATFAFELFYRKKEDNNSYTTRIGWLIDKDKETEAYLLVWPFSNSDDKRGRIDNLKYDDIAGVRYLIVKKNKLLYYLKNKFLTDEKLYKIAKKLFYNDLKGLKDQNILKYYYVDNEGRIYINGWEKDLYFTCSRDMDEQPVNLVIKRDILWLLADMKGDVIGNTAAFETKKYW